MSNTYKASNALLVGRVNKLEQQRDELLEAAKTALGEAESWIIDHLEGTDSYASAMKSLDSVRSIIAKAEASV